MNTIDKLHASLKIMSGYEDDPKEADTDRLWDIKIVAEPGSDYGSAVTIIWDDGEFDGEPMESEHHGYLTTLPGNCEGWDLGGVVHIPHVPGEKCDAGPAWITLYDLIHLPDVKLIKIGKRSLRQEEGVA